MATVPVTRTWVAGEIVTAAYMNNNISSVLSFLLARPWCQVRATSTQATVSGTQVALLFDTEDFDNSGMHSTVTNTSRLTAVYPGWYSADGGPNFAANNVGRRGAEFRVNGASVNGSPTYVAANATSSISKIVSRPTSAYLNVGDYLELYAVQDSGSGINTYATSPDNPLFRAVWQSN